MRRAWCKVVYEADEHLTDFHVAIDKAYRPPRKRMGIPRPPKPRGNVGRRLQERAIQARSRSTRCRPESHQAIEMFATTCVWEERRKAYRL